MGRGGRFVVGLFYATEPFSADTRGHLLAGMTVVICPSSCVSDLAFKRASGTSGGGVSRTSSPASAASWTRLLVQHADQLRILNNRTRPLTRRHWQAIGCAEPSTRRALTRIGACGKDGSRAARHGDG